MTALPVSLTGTGTGRRGDRAFRAVALASGLLVLVILALIAWTTTQKASSAFSFEGLGFVTHNDWSPSTTPPHFGALALVFGTVITSAIALVFAVPVSFGIALFITELAPDRVGRAVTYVVDLLASIPSVVYGLWAAYTLAPNAQHFYERIGTATASVPVLNALFGGHAEGRSIMTAGLILAVMATPIITALTRESLTTVPASDRAGALALGATRWESLRVAVFPRVRSGMVAAVMLGLGRAMGETIAVALVMGGSPQITSHLFNSGSTLAGIIALNFGEATGNHRAALIGCGVLLFALTIAVNASARAIVRRSDRRLTA